MVSRQDRAFVIHMMQRNRRRRDATLNPPDGRLGWINPPPATGATNVEYTAVWQNGKAPYHVHIYRGQDLIKEQHSSATSAILGSDSAGRYEWKITSSDGQTLVGTTIIS